MIRGVRRGVDAVYIATLYKAGGAQLAPLCLNLSLVGISRDGYLCASSLTQVGFEEWMEEKAQTEPKPAIDLTVTVLTTGYWPNDTLIIWRGYCKNAHSSSCRVAIHAL